MFDIEDLFVKFVCPPLELGFKMASVVNPRLRLADELNVATTQVDCALEAFNRAYGSGHRCIPLKVKYLAGVAANNNGPEDLKAKLHYLNNSVELLCKTIHPYRRDDCQRHKHVLEGLVKKFAIGECDLAIAFCAAFDEIVVGPSKCTLVQRKILGTWFGRSLMVSDGSAYNDEVNALHQRLTHHLITQLNRR